MVISGTAAGDYCKCSSCLGESQAEHADETVQQRFTDAQAQFYGGDSVCLLPTVRSIAGAAARLHLQAIRRHLTSGRLLEVGPGGGELLALSAAGGFEPEAVEDSIVLADTLRRRLGVQVHQGMFEALDLAPQAYDAYISCHVIEHVPDPVAHLSKAALVVRPGGFAFIATPHVGSWERRLLGSHWPGYSNAHLNLFSRESLRQVLQRSGFEVVEMRTFEVGASWLRALSALGRWVAGRTNRVQGGGSLIRSTPTPLASSLLNVFAFCSWPFRAVQEAAFGGNELFAVGRRKA